MKEYDTFVLKHAIISDSDEVLVAGTSGVITEIFQKDYAFEGEFSFPDATLEGGKRFVTAIVTINDIR